MPLLAQEQAEQEPSLRWAFDLGHELNEQQRRELFDQYEFELGMLQPAQGKLTYVSGVSQDMPEKRSVKLADDERFYVGGKPPEYLASVLNELQLDTDSWKKLTLVFFSAKTEKLLMKLEKEAHRVKQPIRQTVFRARKTDEGYELYVGSQSHEGDSAKVHENRFP